MPKSTTQDLDPDSLRTVDKEGVAPGHRLRHAHQAYEICDKLDRDDKKRRMKRSRIFKAYNRFPPNEYSKLLKNKMEGSSNVNFGMMAFIVDNNLSSFFDMITERTMAAEIITKHGNPRDRAEWSDGISSGFDRVLREWDEYLFNVEWDLLDMLLYSKGIETWEDDEGCMPEHIPADDFLVPENTKVSLSNWTEICIRRDYTLLELYNKLEASGDEATGWNRKAVINAMRYQRETWQKKTSEDFYKQVADGGITFGGHLKEKVSCYVLYVREFNDKVSKYIILQDYAPAVSLTKGMPGLAKDEEWTNKTIDSEGFLYQKPAYRDDICDVFAIFMDCAGNGIWHRIPSLAEKIFVQCRQYDITMNAIMDAVKMNMSLMIQASSADATQKIKELVFGPLTIIPSETPFVQQRVQLPVQEGMITLNGLMNDMKRGLGEYEVHNKGASGEAPTATQSQLDAAEAAKLTGTQLKRYNGQCSFFYRKLFKRLVSLTTAEKDYKHLQKFKDHCKELGIPDEAWKWENIDSINSNMLAGAGSPSYKLMAAEKTVQLTNITPRDEGQAKALEDALAALHGRANVRRYLAKTVPDLTWNERYAHSENALLAEMSLNPSTVRVYPNDNHMYHVSVHMDDMEKTIETIKVGLESGKIKENFAEHSAYKLLNQGAHVMAHLKFIEKDPLKENEVKDMYARLNEIQRASDDIAKQMQKMMEAKSQQKEFDPSSDPDIQKKLALNALEVEQVQKLNNMKVGAIAAGHAQRAENDKEKTANQIAMERVKTIDQINTTAKAKEQAEAKAAAKKTKTPPAK